MKRPHPSLAPLLAIMLVGTSLWAHAQAFNFLYSVQKTVDAIDLRIFDDGKKTYLQYGGPGDPQIINNDAPTSLVKWRFESPYIVIDGVMNCFQFKTMSFEAHINNDARSKKACPKIEPTPVKLDPSVPVDKKSDAVTPRDTKLIEAKPLMMEIHREDRLSSALSRFLMAQGYGLDWKSPDDFLVREAYVVYGKTLKDILATLESDYGLTLSLNLNRVTVKTGAIRQ